MEHCETCAHWKPYAEAFPRGKHDARKRAGGVCGAFTEDGEDDDYQPDAFVYSYSEGGYLWTGPQFGCVQHKPRKDR